MSKSDDIKNNFLDIENFLNHFASVLGDASKNVQTYSETMEKLLKSSLEREVVIKNANKMTQAEVKRSVANMLDTFKRLGIELGDKGKNIVKHLEDIALAQAKSGRLSNEKFKKDFMNVGLTELFKAQSKATLRGDTDSYIKNFSKNKVAKEIGEEVNKVLGIKTDNLSYKIQSFFGAHFKDADKKLEKFGKELIEGLEKSKFVGGALTDTFKLIGLMGASWLSQFGQFGRILGGAFYVVMSTMGPQLVNLILKGMGSLLWNTTKFLGGKLLDLGKFLGTKFLDFGKFAGNGLVNMSMKAGGPLADLVTASTTGQKALAVGRLAGGATMGLAAGAGALYAGKEAISDWKSGHKGRAASFGVGGLALGAGAIAAIVAGAFAPVTLILVGIGGAIVGLTALWKHHSDAIKGFFKKVSPFFSKVLDFIMMVNPIFMVIKKVMDWILQTKVGEKIKEGVVNAYNNVKDAIFGKSQDTQQVEAIGSMGVNKAGGMLNVRGMNKMQASQAVSEYLKNRPDQFNNVYELSGSKHSYLGSFTNDLAIRNVQGQAQQAVLYKGAGADLEGAWQHLVSSGAMTQERAELLKYTSGRATASSKHKKGGARSHDNIMNMVTDLGTANKWTDSEWKVAFDALKSYYADKGYDLYYEGETAKGETKFGQEFVAGLSNRHFHIAPSKGKEGMMPAGAEENIKQREAKAEQHSINAMSLVKKLEGEDRIKEIYKENAYKSPEEFGEVFEKELKDKYGIFSRKDQKGKEHWIYQDGKSSREFDPTANIEFLKKQMTYVTNNNQ